MCCPIPGVHTAKQAKNSEVPGKMEKKLFRIRDITGT